jgi:predicted dehydrogenase
MKPKQASSRRKFLKNSSLAVAGASLAGSLNVARVAHAAGSDVIKVALIGSGGRGAGAVGQMMDADKNVKLIAIADAFGDRASTALNSLKKKYPDQVEVPESAVYTGLEAYKQALASDASLVVLATPPGFRPQHYAAAIAAGKHVFMEKPCCVDAPGFRKLMETNKEADKKNLFVAVGLQRRHEPVYIERIKQLQDGAIGDINLLRVYWNGSGIWNRPRKEGMTELEYQVYNWYHFCWLSGDNICEQHIHNIDVGNWLKGDKTPVTASGMGGCITRYIGNNKGTGQLFDHHVVEYTYEDGTKMYSECRHIPNCLNTIGEWAHGSKGMSECSLTGGEKKRDRKAEKPLSGHAQEQVDLIAAMRAGRRYNEGYYGATSSMTAVMGRMATYSGKLVKWDEAIASKLTEFPDATNFHASAPVQKNADGDYPIPVPGMFTAV